MYLIDEAFNVGKGANSIISKLHHFFEVHGFGEKYVDLHADNYVGQNKNRFLMYYLMWRVMAGLQQEITISFLLVGHTKQCFRRMKIGDLDDIANCVSQSSAVNVLQLIGSLDGTIFVPTYNWSDFFEDIMKKTALRGISKLQHFRFTAAKLGMVYVNESSSAAE